MRKITIGVLVLSFFLMSGLRGYGQGYATKPYAALELYGGLGTTNSFGDTGGKNGTATGLLAVVDSWGLDPEQTRVSGILGFRYIRNKTWAFNFQVKPLWLSGSDKNSLLGDVGRKFESQTFMVDGIISAEVFLANRLTGPAPYISIGYGLGIYNAKYYDQMVNLEDPSTKNWINNISPYSGGTNMFKWTGIQLTPEFVLGFGVRLPSLSRRLAQNVELRYHYAFKDDVDGYAIGVYPGKGAQYGQIGDSYLVLSYQIVFDLDKTFVYDHRGRINR